MANNSPYKPIIIIIGVVLFCVYMYLIGHFIAEKVVKQ